MFGLSSKRATAPATPSASAPGQKQKNQKVSPLARTMKKLKQAVSFKSSKKKVSPPNERDAHQQQGAGQNGPVPVKPTPAINKPLPPIPTHPTTNTTYSPPSHALGAMPLHLPISTRPHAVSSSQTPFSTRSITDQPHRGPKKVYSNPQPKVPLGLGGGNKKVSARNEFNAHMGQETRGRRQPALNPTTVTGKPFPSKPSTPTWPITRPTHPHLSRTLPGMPPNLPLPPTPPTVSSSRNAPATRSNVDRSYPGPKKVYAAAPAEPAVQPFIKTPNYDFKMTRNVGSAFNVTKKQEERPPSWDRKLQRQLASLRSLATSDDVRRMDQVTVVKASEEATEWVPTGSWLQAEMRSRRYSITTDEMDSILQQPELDWGLHLESAAASPSSSISTHDMERMISVPVEAETEGRSKGDSATASQRYSFTTDDMEDLIQNPLQMNWKPIQGDICRRCLKHAHDLHHPGRSDTGEDFEKVILQCLAQLSDDPLVEYMGGLEAFECHCK